MVLFCLVPVLYLGSAISPILYVRLLRNRSIGVAVALLVALVGVSVLVAGWTVTAFGGAFGPGAWLQCLTPLMIAIPAVLLVVNASEAFFDFDGDRVRQIMYVAGGLLICLCQLAPLLGHAKTNRVCYERNKEIAAPIIEAVESYHEEHGKYPDDLESLVPAHLSRVPAPSCQWVDIVGGARKFRITHCEPDVSILTVGLVDGWGDQRYEFATGDWASISALDGVCSFLH